MANDLNRCEFIGRVGKDPEVRYTQGGTAVASLSIAVGKSWKDKGGEKQEQTTWVPLVVWNKLAEIVKEYVVKGSQIYVSGEFSVRKWEDKDGNDRWSTEVVVNQLQLLGSKGGGSGRASGHGSDEPQGGRYASDNFSPDDDIPFRHKMRRFDSAVF